jgi:acyl-coenzyme A thioesterase PaaI-like protein
MPKHPKIAALGKGRDKDRNSYCRGLHNILRSMKLIYEVHAGKIFVILRRVFTLWQRFQERFVNLYPPLLGAGIRSRAIDQRTIYVELKMTPLNRNVVGVHFGGSLYAMCDPWFMLIMMRELGREYIVWDKAASIKFVKPGRGKVSATFHVPQDRVDEIRKVADGGQKIEPIFMVDVVDEQGQVIAHVEKLLYVRRKNEPVK